MGFFIKPSPTYPRPLYGTPHLTRAVATLSPCGVDNLPTPPKLLPTLLYILPRPAPAYTLALYGSPTLTSIAAAYPPTKIQKEGLKSPPKLSHTPSYTIPLYTLPANPLHRPSCPCQRGERTRPPKMYTTLIYRESKRGEEMYIGIYSIGRVYYPLVAAAPLFYKVNICLVDRTLGAVWGGNPTSI